MVKNKGKRKWYLLTAVLVLVLSVVYLMLDDKPRRLTEAPQLEVSFQTQRFDQALWANRQQLGNGAASFKATYVDFIPFYAEQLVEVSRANDPAMYNNLQAFLQDPYIDTVYRDVLASYPDFKAIDAEFDRAFRFYKKHFPQAPLYDIITFVSGFKYKTALIDSAVLVGLDLYLGPDYKYYPMVDFMTLYLMRRLSPEHIVPDAMQLILEDLLPAQTKATQLLHRMMEQGKVLYALKQILPDVADSLIYGYSSAQMAWVNQNERNIWAYMLNRDILFTSDLGEVARFMNDGPFTNGLPEESPARLGPYIGSRIIASYMTKNKTLPLAELFALTDYDLLFKEAGYKPK